MERFFTSWKNEWEFIFKWNKKRHMCNAKRI